MEPNEPLTYSNVTKLFAEYDQAMTTLTKFFKSDENGRKALHELIDAWLDAPERQQ